MTLEAGQVGGETSVVAPMLPMAGATAAAPVRMSRMAVTAFIIGILACLTCITGYVFGVVGNILAISALILIRRHEPQLRGKSLAMVAIGLNSLAFLFGVVFTAGAAQFARTALRYATPLEQIQHNELENAKGAFTTAVAADLTPQKLAAFDNKVKEQLGAYTSVPSSDLIEFLRRALDGIRDQSAALNSLPADNKDSLFVLPTDFEKGRALVIVCLDSSDKTAQYSLGRIRNLGVLKDGSGEIIWLVPLKDKSPAGLLAPIRDAAPRESAAANGRQDVARNSGEVVPPPAPPSDQEPKNVLPPS